MEYTNVVAGEFFLSLNNLFSKRIPNFAEADDNNENYAGRTRLHNLFLHKIFFHWK